MITFENSKKYFYLSIFCFIVLASLELFSLGVIEPFLFGYYYSDYTIFQKGLHSLITSLLWAISIMGIIRYRSKLDSEIRTKENEDVTNLGFFIFICLLFFCKVITYIDWGTLKIIGEIRTKENLYLVITQYIYYIFEVALVSMIIIYAQKSIDSSPNLSCPKLFPFGGLVLSLTWGAFHFISNGIDLWNGISCMLFSLLAGMAYQITKQNEKYLLCFVMIGYLI